MSDIEADEVKASVEEEAQQQQQQAGGGGIEDSEEEEEDGQLGSLFVDKEDKQRLENMSQLEREMIIYQRAEEQDNQRLLQKSSSDDEKGPDVRASSRLSAQRNRRHAMSELRQKRAAREKKHADEDDEDVGLSDEDGNDASTYNSDNDFIDDDADDDEFEEESFGKPKKSQKRQRETADEARSSSRRRGGYVQEVEGTGFEGATYSDIKGIQITRDVVEQWLNEHYFEETLPDCIVKVADGEKNDPITNNVSPNYLVAAVVAIQEGDKYYKFTDKIKTNKQVVVRDGNEERWFHLNLISRQAITKLEFDNWVAKQESVGEDPMTRATVEAIKERIHKANTYTYTAQDVKQIIEERRRKGSVVVNPVMEKVRLRRLVDYHRENNNMEEVERLEGELLQIEQRIEQDAKLQKPSAYDMINQRNKQARLTTRPMKQTSTQALASKKDINALKLTPEEIAERRAKFDPVKVLKEMDWSVDLGVLDTDRAKMTMAKKLLGTRFKLTEDKLSIPLSKNRNNVLTIMDYKQKQGLN